MRVSLLRQIRMLGLRRGFRVWRLLSGPDVIRPPELHLSHGERPTLPGYRRHKRR